jgi:hypothetical protein
MDDKFINKLVGKEELGTVSSLKDDDFNLHVNYVNFSFNNT